MNILLVNPNRFKSPPVPPLGLEYIAGCLEKDGHNIRLIDLCFSGNISQDLDNAVKSFNPDIAGITIRNVDSVLYPDNEFYLDEIREIVHYLKASHNLQVLIGGTGLMTNPQGVLDYLWADYAFVGPAEEELPGFLNMIRNSHPAEKIYYGHCKPDFACPRRSSSIEYDKYYKSGGIAGFETHKGCSSSCVYCLEANSRVAFKRPGDIIQEISGFIDAGYNHFHLCDPEFNEDLDFSLAFCNALKFSGIALRWAVYMKPTNYNRKLFRLMKETGVYLITLTVDSFNKCSMYWSDVEKIIFNAKSNGISLAVDFLAGFPHEKENVLIECLDLFRRVQPDVVNINTYIRLYKTLKVTQTVLKDSTLHPCLLGATDDSSMIRPVFYNHVSDKRLEELIAGDNIFKIAGREKDVNYCSVNENRMKGQ
jgi:tRNA A37 methylthiotransferase MiaB